MMIQDDFYSMFFVLCLVVHLNSINSHCLRRDLYNAEALLQKTRSEGCHLQESTHGAGSVHNVQANCMQSKDLGGSFFYNITWSHLKQNKTPITKYCVYIRATLMNSLFLVL